MTTQFIMLAIAGPATLVLSLIFFYISGYLDMKLKSSDLVGLFIALGVVFIVASFMIALFGLIYTVDAHSCHVKGNEMNIDSKYTISNGCRINIDGKWIPVENYRVTN